MEDHSVKNVCTADETSRISALDLYEDLLVRDLSNNDCLSVHEVIYEKDQLKEKNRLLQQELSQATECLKIITEQHNALKKNYASLLQTAKAELTRKSRMLAQSAGSSGSCLLGKERSFQRHNVRAEQRTSLKGKRVGDETPQSISQSLGSHEKKNDSAKLVPNKSSSTTQWEKQRPHVATTTPSHAERAEAASRHKSGHARSADQRPVPKHDGGFKSFECGRHGNNRSDPRHALVSTGSNGRRSRDRASRFSEHERVPAEERKSATDCSGKGLTREMPGGEQDRFLTSSAKHPRPLTPPTKQSYPDLRDVLNKRHDDDRRIASWSSGTIVSGDERLSDNTPYSRNVIDSKKSRFTDEVKSDRRRHCDDKSGSRESVNHRPPPRDRPHRSLHNKNRPSPPRRRTNHVKPRPLDREGGNFLGKSSQNWRRNEGDLVPPHRTREPLKRKADSSTDPGGTDCTQREVGVVEHVQLPVADGSLCGRTSRGRAGEAVPRKRRHAGDSIADETKEGSKVVDIPPKHSNRRLSCDDAVCRSRQDDGCRKERGEMRRRSRDPATISDASKRDNLGTQCQGDGSARKPDEMLTVSDKSRTTSFRNAAASNYSHESKSKETGNRNNFFPNPGGVNDTPDIGLPRAVISDQEASQCRVNEPFSGKDCTKETVGQTVLKPTSERPLAPSCVPPETRSLPKKQSDTSANVEIGVNGIESGKSPSALQRSRLNKQNMAPSVGRKADESKRNRKLSAKKSTDIQQNTTSCKDKLKKGNCDKPKIGNDVEKKEEVQSKKTRLKHSSLPSDVAPKINHGRSSGDVAQSPPSCLSSPPNGDRPKRVDHHGARHLNKTVVEDNGSKTTDLPSSGQNEATSGQRDKGASVSSASTRQAASCDSHRPMPEHCALNDSHAPTVVCDGVLPGEVEVIVDVSTKHVEGEHPGRGEEGRTHPVPTVGPSPPPDVSLCSKGTPGFKAGRSFMHYYRNASLHCLVHLARKSLNDHRNASLTSGHSLEANSGERICDDKANIETPPTSETGARAVWMASLKECQERRKLRSRWMSERTDDDVTSGVDVPFGNPPEEKVSTVTSNVYVEAISTLSRASSSSSWTTAQQAISDFFNMGSMSKTLTPIKSTPHKAQGSDEATTGHAQRVCRRVLQS